ncbi:MULTISPECIES: hypothetical protein [Actinoallomurus]|uniref:hypothetical protein n=1 Tax=Actinoallomurus TaxID=667113 RepID=UPI0020924170|nr:MULTISPECIES: hypothetical protein [Actinoallomurus]MCO5971652.1 hypothetical protein [Actinoallomurus soli]MCO5997858.1 hypothetical protein [Actinoallomurus rhizosphaericola]
MPTYRVRTNDGDLRTVQALRLCADLHHVRLEERAAGDWRTVLEVPLGEVEQVQRRLNEPNGSWIWITEKLPAAPSA